MKSRNRTSTMRRRFLALLAVFSGGLLTSEKYTSRQAAGTVPA